MSKIKKFIPYLIILIVLVSYGIFIQQNTGRFQRLLNLSLDSFLVLLVLILCSITARGLINYHLYKGLEIPIPFFKSLGLATINTLGNQLPFSGGLVAKGIYLKKRYELSYTTFLSATVSLFLGFMTANGIIGLITLLSLSFFQQINPNGVLVFGFTMMTLSISMQWIKINYDFLPEKWKRYMKQLMDGWQVFRKNIGLWMILICLQIVSTFLTAGRFWVSFRFLSQDIPLTHCLLFSAATILTQLISIAPGGIGVREGIVAGIAAIMGVDPGISAIAVGIDRLLATSIIVITGSAFSYILSKDALEVSVKEGSDIENV